MDQIKEFIKEQVAITQWDGVRVRVIIENPQIEYTMTSQMIIDRRDIEQLKYLKRSETLEMMIASKPELAKYELLQYDTERKKAERIIDRIAGEIANHITRNIGQKI